MSPADFRPGDVVALKTGAALQAVEAVDVDSRGDTMLRTRYLSDAAAKYYPPSRKSASRFRLVRRNNDTENQTMTAKLYKTADGRFGTYLATDSRGQIVLEMKGTGAAEAFNPKDAEVVMPYTVRLVSGAGGSDHFRAVPGSVAKDDLVVFGGTLYIVASLDTKSDTKRVLKGRKLSSEPLPEVDAEQTAED